VQDCLQTTMCVCFLKPRHYLDRSEGVRICLGPCCILFRLKALLLLWKRKRRVRFGSFQLGYCTAC